MSNYEVAKVVAAFAGLPISLLLDVIFEEMARNGPAPAARFYQALTRTVSIALIVYIVLWMDGVAI